MARVGRAVRARTRASRCKSSPSRNDNSARGPMMVSAPSSSVSSALPRPRGRTVDRAQPAPAPRQHRARVVVVRVRVVDAVVVVRGRSGLAPGPAAAPWLRVPGPPTNRYVPAARWHDVSTTSASQSAPSTLYVTAARATRAAAAVMTLTAMSHAAIQQTTGTCSSASPAAASRKARTPASAAQIPSQPTQSRWR
jgi:hypothetical protein